MGIGTSNFVIRWINLLTMVCSFLFRSFGLYFLSFSALRGNECSCFIFRKLFELKFAFFCLICLIFLLILPAILFKFGCFLSVYFSYIGFFLVLVFVSCSNAVRTFCTSAKFIFEDT